MFARRVLGLGAGLLLLALPAPAALAGSSVSVRVEGEAATLLASNAVTLPDAPSAPNVAACGKDASPSNAFEALDLATAGIWDRAAFFSSVLGETHSFAKSDYWATWIERAGTFRFGAGVCTDELQPGDELLLIVDVAEPPPSYAATTFPLGIQAPVIVKPGEPFTIDVSRWVPAGFGDPGSGVKGPAAGVDVTSSASTAKTGADGRATLTLTERGPATLAAARGTTRAKPVEVCVSDGADGYCSTARPVAAVAPIAQAARDTTPALASIAGLREQQVFARGRGPRSLGGSVAADASGVRDVRLRLTRRRGGACQTFDAASERLVKSRRCGTEGGLWFSIGDRASWTYLLPFRLPAGRWVLDVRTVDGAGNVTRGADRSSDRAKPRTRVVFHVR